MILPIFTMALSPLVFNLVVHDTPLAYADELPSCKQRRKLMGLDNEDEHIIVEGHLGQQIQLECHYCNEGEDEGIQKLWYHRNSFFMSPAKEVTQDFGHQQMEDRKLVVNEHHTLIVNNITEDDGGIYFCQGYEDSTSKFNYVVDVVGEGYDISIKTEKEIANFKKKVLAPINKKLEKVLLLKSGNLDSNKERHLQIELEWSAWGACKVCNRIVGIRKRSARCLLRLTEKKSALKKLFSGIFKKSKFGIGFSCHSLILDKIIADSDLVNEIRQIPALVETDNCAGECKSNIYLHLRALEKLKEENDGGDVAEDVQIITENPIPFETRYILMNVTEEEFGKPFILRCPKEKEGEIVWLREESLIAKGKRMEVDGLDRLLLKNIEIEDMGNYTCYIDEQKIAVFKLMHWSTFVRMSAAEISAAWGTFVIIVIGIWGFCVAVIHLNHKKVSRGFLRRISLNEDYDEIV